MKKMFALLPALAPTNVGKRAVSVVADKNLIRGIGVSGLRIADRQCKAMLRFICRLCACASNDQQHDQQDDGKRVLFHAFFLPRIDTRLHIVMAI